MADANCVLAFSAGAYDVYLGDSTVAALSNAGSYARLGGSTKYGWSGAPCLTPAASICQIPASIYPCPSPPNPPTSPDAPYPFPPVASTEPSCE